MDPLRPGEFEVSPRVPEKGEPGEFVLESMKDCQSKKPKLVAFQFRGPRSQCFAVVKPKIQN